MNSLEPPDIHYLRAAQGWLELGDHLEAARELDRISSSQSEHPLILMIRWMIFARAKRWEGAVPVADALVNRVPQDAYGWILRSFALHQMRQTQEAWNQLLPGAEKFPKEPNIPYNLACYATQLGRLEEARKWLRRAFEIGDGKKITLKAMQDPNLEPLWRGIGSA
jgi:predicted Zn-dependent protease